MSRWPNQPSAKKINGLRISIILNSSNHTRWHDAHGGIGQRSGAGRNSTVYRLSPKLTAFCHARTPGHPYRGMSVSVRSGCPRHVRTMSGDVCISPAKTVISPQSIAEMLLVRRLGSLSTRRKPRILPILAEATGNRNHRLPNQHHSRR